MSVGVDYATEGTLYYSEYSGGQFLDIGDPIDIGLPGISRRRASFRTITLLIILEIQLLFLYEDIVDAKSNKLME